MVTSFVLLFTELGGAVGTAVLGAVQTTVIPNRLLRYLPGAANATLRASMFAAPSTAIVSYPLGTPERSALIRAWSDYMHILLIISITFSAIPVILGCFLSDRKLNDKQNCVTDEPTMSSFNKRERTASESHA